MRSLPGLVAAGPLREAGGGAEHLGCGVFVSLSVSAPGPRRLKGFSRGQVRTAKTKTYISSAWKLSWSVMATRYF